jgi:hypothetical protein
MRKKKRFCNIAKLLGTPKARITKLPVETP